MDDKKITDDYIDQKRIEQLASDHLMSTFGETISADILDLAKKLESYTLIEIAYYLHLHYLATHEVVRQHPMILLRAVIGEGSNLVQQAMVWRSIATERNLKELIARGVVDPQTAKAVDALKKKLEDKVRDMEEGDDHDE